MRTRNDLLFKIKKAIKKFVDYITGRVHKKEFMNFPVDKTISEIDYITKYCSDPYKYHNHCYQLLIDINVKRFEKGLIALSPPHPRYSGMISWIYKLAMYHVEIMLSSNKISHDDFEYRAKVVREALLRNDNAHVGEVISHNFSTPISHANALLNSPEHKNILLSKDFDTIIIGFSTNYKTLTLFI
jgi:hypothetical protein